MISKAPANRPIVVQIVGGLGNQLFGLFAGLYISQKLGTTLVIDDSEFDRGVTSHGSTIRSLDLEVKVTDDYGGGLFSNRLLTKFLVAITTILENLRKDSLRFSLSMIRTPKLALKALAAAWAKGPSGQFALSQLRSRNRVFTSRVIGFDSNLDRLAKPGMLIRGYFQTYKYAESVLSNSEAFQFNLKNPSPWYSEFESEIMSSPILVVHVRRGDYLKFSSEIGVLSDQYFLNAIAQAKKVNPDLDEKTWIFSDDIQGVRKDFEGLITGPVRWVEPPKGSDAAETMKLMSLGASMVISNSTFSWWAAMLGAHKEVYYPSKWFIGKPDPLELVPPSWTPVESIWL